MAAKHSFSLLFYAQSNQKKPFFLKKSVKSGAFDANFAKKTSEPPVSTTNKVIFSRLNPTKQCVWSAISSIFTIRVSGQKKCGARVYGSRSGVNQELGNYLRVGVSQSIHSDLFHLAMLLKDSTLPFVVPLSFKKALT